MSCRGEATPSRTERHLGLVSEHGDDSQLLFELADTCVIFIRILFLVLYLFNGFYGVFFVYSDCSLTVSERYVQSTARVGSLGKISGQ
jgi:hypothetical protein